MFRTTLILALAACTPGGEDAPDDPLKVADLVCLDVGVARCAEERTAYDADGDGIFDNAYTEVRDGDHVVSILVDYDADGVDDATADYTFDAKGRPLTAAFDYDADGVIDATDTETWTDGAFNTTHYVDAGTDGSVELKELITLDAAGREVEILADVANDGEIDEATRYEYDDAGRLSAVRYDGGADGTVESVQRWEYDELGRTTLKSLDLGDDGRDTWTTWTYDDCDRVITSVEASTTSPANRADWTYDAEGRPATRIDDDYADGVPDRITRWSRTATLEVIELATSADDVVFLRIEHDLDADGRVIAERYDVGADGDLDSQWELDAVCDG